MVTQEKNSTVLISVSQEAPKTPIEFAESFRQMQQEYQRANAKSAHAVLSFCKVVHDASVAFSDEKRLDEFKKHAKLTKKSTYSQFRTIGATYDRLVPRVEQLPSSWYTLYLIATLPEELLDAAIATNRIHPFATQRDVMSVANKLKPSRKKTPNLDDCLGIQIGFTSPESLTEDRFNAVWEALSAVLRQHLNGGFWLARTKALDKHLKTQSKPVAAGARQTSSNIRTEAHAQPVAA